MAYRNDKAYAAPFVDHQGILGTCVCNATAKVVMNGHETKKFFGEALDFKQGEVTTALINEFKVWIIENLKALQFDFHI